MWRSWWFRGWLIYCAALLGTVAAMLAAEPLVGEDDPAACLPGTIRTMAVHADGGGAQIRLERFCMHRDLLDTTTILAVVATCLLLLVAGLLVRALRRR